MKKFIVFFICLINISPGYTQVKPCKKNKEYISVTQLPSDDEEKPYQKKTYQLLEVPIPNEEVNIVTIVDIGTSANAFTYWKKLSALWVDPELNTVVNIHLMGGDLDPDGGSGDLGYDISKDGGTTWMNMIEVFKGYSIDSSQVSVRYPQAGIYNPEGNTNTDEAFVTYFAPATDTLNQLWSYAHGIGNLGDTSIHTQNLLLSDDNFYQNIPLGFDITSNGQVFIVDRNWDEVFRDSLIISRGTWDDDLMDFVFERENLEAVFSEDFDFPFDCKIAFGPDGQTGYIAVLGNNGEAWSVPGQPNIYPIFWKTVDGGESWDGPQIIQIDGPEGIDGIVNHLLTDEQIEQIY